jgi:IclR-like helix-turn-helix domain-containing protein
LPRLNGYIAKARASLTHPTLSRGKSKRFDRRSALDWLIAEAAWRPDNRRGSHGIFHVARGQLCITITDLCTAWHWPRSTVHRFLKELTRESTIAVRQVRAGQKMERNLEQTPIELPLYAGWRRSLITICNYDKYQRSSTASSQNSDNHMEQTLGTSFPATIQETTPVQYEMATGIGIVASTTKETINPFIKADTKGQPRAGRRPRHGQRWKNLVWLATDTPEWDCHAADFEAVRGKLPKAVRYYDGICGQWFVFNGEANRVQLRRA